MLVVKLKNTDNPLNRVVGASGPKPSKESVTMTAMTTFKALGAMGLLAFAVGGSQAATIITSYSSPDLVVDSYDTATAGTSVAPWLVNETLSGSGHGHLKFEATQGASPVGPGNETGSGIHQYGRWISKTILNNTTDVWTSFELELQSVFGTPSDDSDGLSFAQNGGLLFSSDAFSSYTRLDITRDYLNFSGGSVGIGESVTFKFAITDNQTNNPIYLLQTANKTDRIPEPATLALVGLALVGLGLARRRG